MSKYGKTVQAQIQAINKNLVWHAIQVSKDAYFVSILNWHNNDKNLVSFCRNVLGAAIEMKTQPNLAGKHINCKLTLK